MTDATDDDGESGSSSDALGAPSPGYRAFSASSYWNTPLPASAPVDPGSASMITWLTGNSSPKYLNLGGGAFGQPIYWAASSDPIKKIKQTQYAIPAELRNGVRIPANARPADSSDGELSIFDVSTGYVWNTWHTVINADGSWSAGGADIWYLGSNGLDGRLAQSDDDRNGGHRGYPQAALGMVRFDEVQSGAIRHVLKVALNDTASCHAFPGVGDESGSGKICEGARLRIKPSVDLTKKGLTAAALVVARAAQTYGVVVGDQSGGQFNLKLENTVREGRGDLWKGVLASNSLSTIPISDWEVIKLGYGQ